MLVTCQIFGDLFLFGLVWQYSAIQKNIMKVGSKPWLLTCISNITLSLPSLYFSESKRELNFCNDYLSLLYFCTCLSKVRNYGDFRHTCIPHHNYMLITGNTLQHRDSLHFLWGKHLQCM